MPPSGPKFPTAVPIQGQWDIAVCEIRGIPQATYPDHLIVTPCQPLLSLQTSAALRARDAAAQ